MHAARGVPEPRVALLNIGEEGSKGSPLTIEAHERLAGSELRFVGNIEGRDLPWDRADVVVTDGFTGNVVLKLAEGVIAMMLDEFQRAARGSWRARLGGLLLRPAARGIRDKLDYRLHGAAPLLGVDGAVFIAHGSSDGAAIESAIRRAAEAADRGTPRRPPRLARGEHGPGPQRLLALATALSVRARSENAPSRSAESLSPERGYVAVKGRVWPRGLPEIGP